MSTKGEFLYAIIEYSLRCSQHVPNSIPPAVITEEPVGSHHPGGWKNLTAGMQIKFARVYALALFSLHIQISP